MQITIYFNDKPVFLCSHITKELQEHLKHPDTVFIEELSNAAVNSLLHEIKKDSFHVGILCHENFDLLKKTFFKHFTAIEAAGGIVQNEQKDILFIHRLGKWDLPKGKVEKGESLELAATREITEETGLKYIQLKKKIGETYHTYDAFGKHFLKTTHWYYLISTGNEDLVPQIEEDITNIKWFKTMNIKEPMSDTYANIKDIMHQFFDTP